MISALVLASAGAFIYHKANDKQAYDYSEFYEEVTPDEESEIEETMIEEEPEMVLFYIIGKFSELPII